MLASHIGFIGAGRMATALARICECQARLSHARSSLAIQAVRKRESNSAVDVPGAKIVAENTEVVSKADVVFLAVKPQQMSDVLAGVRDSIRGEALVVSIAAGVTLARLAAGLPPSQRIVRVMPNTPCLIGRGASAYSLGSARHRRRWPSSSASCFQRSA